MLAITSIMMWDRSDESRHIYFCPVSDLKGKICSLSPLNTILAVGFSQIAFSKLSKFPSISSLLNIFIMKGYLTAHHP